MTKRQKVWKILELRGDVPNEGQMWEDWGRESYSRLLTYNAAGTVVVVESEEEFVERYSHAYTEHCEQVCVLFVNVFSDAQLDALIAYPESGAYDVELSIVDRLNKESDKLRYEIFSPYFDVPAKEDGGSICDGNGGCGCGGNSGCEGKGICNEIIFEPDLW
jgi:hypothetical protein